MNNWFINIWARLTIVDNFLFFFLGVPWILYFVLYFIVLILVIFIYIISILYKPVEIAQLALLVDINSLICTSNPTFALNVMYQHECIFLIVTNMPTYLYINMLSWIGWYVMISIFRPWTMHIFALQLLDFAFSSFNVVSLNPNDIIYIGFFYHGKLIGNIWWLGLTL